MTTKTSKRSFPHYYYQLEDNYCGPACAQMILEYLKVTNLDQDTIARVGESPASPRDPESPYMDWFTRPDELLKMLQELAPVPDRTFTTPTFTDNVSFRKRLKQFVEDESIPPPIVPVNGGGHWVVLFQYHVNGNNGFFVGYDPAKGRGAVPGAPSEIKIPDRRGYFKQASNLVAIVKSSAESDPAHTGEVKSFTFAGPSEVYTTNGAPADVTEIEEPPIKMKVMSSDPVPSSDSRHLSPQVIQKQAKEEMVAYGVIDPNTPNDIPPDAPLLVKVPGVSDENYYLIGVQDSSNKNRALTRLDAIDGQLLDSLSIPPTECLLGKSCIGSELYNKVHAQLDTLMNNKSWAQAFEAELKRTYLDGVEEPNLIWKMCNESQSPFYPFYEVRDGQTTFYVRIDGEVFTELTTRRREVKPANLS